MSHPGGAPLPHSGNFLPSPYSNALDLHGDQMRVFAYHVEQEGLNRGQLFQIYNGQLARRNPLLSQSIDLTGQAIKREGGDLASFNRGATLAYFLIDRSSENGAPIVDTTSVDLIAKHLNQPQSLSELWLSSDRLLSSQAEFDEAFSQGIKGLPEQTEHTMARLGGGIMLLSEMTTTELGRAGADMWFRPPPKP